MNVGIVCYASVGGSGIVATELAKVLARRGHEVRLISSEPPVRLGDFQGRSGLPRRSDSRLPPVSRAAVPALVGQQDRRGGAGLPARHHPCPLRDSACHGGVPGAPDTGRGGRRTGAAGHHDAPRHGRDAHRQRPLLPGDGGLLDRPLRRGHGGVREPARRHVPAPAGPRPHPGHSQFPRLPVSPPLAGRVAARALSPGRSRRPSGHPRVQFSDR